MAETTRTSLISDEDVRDLQVARWQWKLANPNDNIYGHDDRAALETVAPRLRARWVADALEELVSPDYVARAGMAPPVDEIRRVAAEYRAGTR